MFNPTYRLDIDLPDLSIQKQPGDLMIEDYYDKPTVKVNFARYRKSRSRDRSYRRRAINCATTNRTT